MTPLFTYVKTIFAQVKVHFDNDNEQQCAGAFDKEHNVARILTVIRHVSVLRNAGGDLLHFLALDQVRCLGCGLNYEFQFSNLHHCFFRSF